MSLLGCLFYVLVTAIIIEYSVADECPAGRDQHLTPEARIRKDILCDYNTDFRPVKDYKNAVNVKVRLSLKYLSFDNFEETLTIHSWVAVVWKDEFLSWTPVDYDNIEEIIVESHEIWTPRLALFNADASTYNSDTFYTTCMIKSDGTVMCVPHLAHSGICRTNLLRWPYDKQNCTLYFGSWMHTGEQVNFTFYPNQAVLLDEFQPGPGWKLLEVKHKRLPGKYSCCPNATYPMLKYAFELQREAAGPAAIIVVPCVVLVLLTLTSLLLDVKDNIRLVLGCFSLFGHFLFLTEIGYNIPKHSSDTPIILLFIRDSMIMTLTAVMITLLLMSLRRRTSNAPPIVLFINRLASSGPGKYVVFTEFDPSDGKILTEEAVVDERVKNTTNWLQFSNIFNSVTFIILFLVYAVIMFTYIPFNDE